MLTVGINSGAVGVLTAADAFKGAFDLHGHLDRASLRTGLEQVLSGQSARVVIEKAPGWGPAADAIREEVQSLRMPVQFVDQARWRRGLALADFELAPVRRASALFPEAGLQDAHMDRAAALLLAHWVIAGRSRKTLTLSGRVSGALRARARDHGRI